MKDIKLFYLVLGATLPGKHTEQHDVLFGVSSKLADLVLAAENHWDAIKEVHLDAWREVTNVNGYEILIVEKGKADKNGLNLYFINLGGYKTGSFSEHHYQQLVVALTVGEAVKIAKQNVFCTEFTVNENSRCHVDNKFGIDTDDSVEVVDILLPEAKAKYSISIVPKANLAEDELHVGYFPLNEIK
ncbi:MAG: DUF1543 domain-containing protein [Paludibacter sp.]